jgi:hypothetical protein
MKRDNACSAEHSPGPILLTLESEDIQTTSALRSRRAKALSLILLVIAVSSAGSYLMFYRGTTSQIITITPVVTTAAVTQIVVTPSTATEGTTTRPLNPDNRTTTFTETRRTTPRTQLAIDERLLGCGQRLHDERLSEAYILFPGLAQRSQHGAERHD